MEIRVKRALLDKIDETVSNIGEIRTITSRLDAIALGSRNDFALGIAVGRVYNSFHYQTRRVLKRNATEKEFVEFLKILTSRVGEIRKALNQQ